MRSPTSTLGPLAPSAEPAGRVADVSTVRLVTELNAARGFRMLADLRSVLLGYWLSAWVTVRGRLGCAEAGGAE